jgi:hypothetical protein
MDQPSLYDVDIVSWSEQQAAAVRALARRPELSNALDWENVIEEIESVGRSEIASVESALSQMLVHIVKYVSAPGTQPTGSWRREIIVFQASAARNYRASMRQRIDWQLLWTSAIRIADASLNIFGDKVVRGLPATMPFAPEELVATDFDADRALERFAAVLKPPL